MTCFRHYVVLPPCSIETKATTPAAVTSDLLVASVGVALAGLQLPPALLQLRLTGGQFLLQPEGGALELGHAVLQTANLPLPLLQLRETDSCHSNGPRRGETRPLPTCSTAEKI